MPILSDQDVQIGPNGWANDSTPQIALGSRGVAKGGRIFRYCRMGAVASVAGAVYQASSFIGGNASLVISTTSPVAAGTTAIDVTCASSVGLNQYANGYLGIQSGIGMGYLYTVERHAAVSTGATGRFFLYSEDPIQVTITTTGIVVLLANEYDGVIISPATTLLGAIVGVATYVITALFSGWLQTWGPALVFTSGTPALGAPVLGTATSAGRVSLVTAATLLTQATIGSMMMTGVEAQYCLVYLKIAP